MRCWKLMHFNSNNEMKGKMQEENTAKNEEKSQPTKYQTLTLRSVVSQNNGEKLYLNQWLARRCKAWSFQLSDLPHYFKPPRYVRSDVWQVLEEERE